MATTSSPEELQARITELEARMDRLEHSRGAESASAHSADTGPADKGHATTATVDADRATTSRRDRAEEDSTIGGQEEAASASPSPAPDDPYWVLTGLKERYPDDDFVLYGGTKSTDGGGYRWQYALPTETVLDADFADAAPALTALAHPVRLALLQAVLTGTHATADLAALPGLGTSGQVYHHLNQLASAGWLRSPRRGRWEVPGERTIPLLALIMAATT